LCLPTADATMGSNWKVSANDLGFMHNNKAVFGTPGTTNSIGVCSIEPDTIVEVSDFKFSPSSVTINKGQTVRWKNISGSHNINGKKETFPNNPESFSNGAPASGSWTFDYTFTIPGTYDYQCDPHAGQMKGKVIVLDPNPPLTYPSRSIVSMSSVNSNGVVDSLNARCAIEGIVHGVNLRAAGLQFTIIDNANNGIGVFNGGANLGYTVKEGDKIKVEGTVGQFNGFTQVTAVTITKISEGNALVSPKLVTSYAENDESSLIGISGLKFADASQWTGTGAGFNVTMSNGTDSYIVRVDNDINAYSLPIPDPNKTYIVFGLLGQFDASEPYTEGYQLLPRYIADFDPLGNVSEGNFALTIQPNPTNGIFNIVSDVTIDRIDVCDIKGRPVLAPSNANTVDMSNLPTGCYIIRVAASDKVTHRKVWKF
jgi:plastocyanin